MGGTRASIEVIIRDDEGNITSQGKAKEMGSMSMSVLRWALMVRRRWYHLTKKLRELMSMITRSKPEKQAPLKVLLAQLWRGQTQTALDYIRHQVMARNREKIPNTVCSEVL